MVIHTKHTYTFCVDLSDTALGVGGSDLCFLDFQNNSESMPATLDGSSFKLLRIGTKKQKRLKKYLKHHNIFGLAK